MDDVSRFIADLLIVLVAGLIAGAISKRLDISLLVGYFVVGAIIGEGGLGLVTQENRELEYLARGGALFLLFAVGIEFSLEELIRLSRYFLIGGSVQMVLVAIPLAAACLAFGMTWNAAILAGSAGALSSTVLVFKALAEWGQTATPHGRRAIGILLFQDVALIPLMLLIPLLTNAGDAPTVSIFAMLAAKSACFVVVVVLLRWLISRWVVPGLAEFRSVELVILFALSLLGGVCWTAQELGLPPAIGALSTGIMLSGNRLSKQIDTVVLPFRETFAAVFFVTLGTLLHPTAFLHEPLLLTVGLLGMLALKTGAAAVALKIVGLRWSAALATGLGLAQLGEFSFLVLAEGVAKNLITAENYNRMLFIALGTLILTPQLLKFGLRWTDLHDDQQEQAKTAIHDHRRTNCAVVIGIGTIGRRIVSHLETIGFDVCLVDQSPINLHAYAQQGMHSIVGDARDPSTLRRANVEQCRLVVVTIPRDDAAKQVVRSLRELNPHALICARCRYEASANGINSAGATLVVSDESQTVIALVQRIEQHLT